MLDPISQRAVVNRITQERVAEARREHLLRAARQERDAYEVRGHAGSPSLRTTIASALGSVRHGLASHDLTHHGHQPVHGAAAR